VNGPRGREREIWEQRYLAELWRRNARILPRPARHVKGWETIPCRCGVCRADRFVNRVAGILVGLCVGYFVAQIAALALR
jgi:hypothetical protein